MIKRAASCALLTLLNVACVKNINQGSEIAHLSLPARIQALIKNTDPNVNIGIKIVALKNNRVLYEQNADRHFVPGSTIKLATVAAALYYLGPFYRFNTNIFTDNFNYKNGAVKNIYLEGSGDPSLMDHDLVGLAQELKQQKIKAIHGNIYVDDYIFDNILWSRGAMWDDRKFGYGAPVCGLNLNYNRLLIKTLPAHKPNILAHVITKPDTGYIKASSRAQTTEDKIYSNINISVEHKNQEKAWSDIINDGLNLGDHVYINGTLPTNAEPSYSLLAIKDPAMLAGTFFKEQLQLLGIDFKGKVIRQKTPLGALKIASHQSRTLAEALIDFTKISNNIANDSLIKAIAAQAGEKPATFSNGVKLVGQFLAKEVGIAEGSIVNADGAGLSRYNLITPDQFTKLLKYAANHFSSGPEFMASMPLVGLDGNLSSRLKSSPHLAGDIRAKSGSLTGVSGLAGYFTAENNERYAFSILINGFVGSIAKYTNLQDQILSALLPQADKADTSPKQKAPEKTALSK